MKKLIVAVLFLLGPAFVFAGLKIDAPYELFLQGYNVPVVLAASLLALALLLWLSAWRTIIGKLLILLWCLPPLSVLYAQTAFLLCKRNVLLTEATKAQLLGQHFIVGYSSFTEVATLAEKGLIAGIYITKHNVENQTAETVRSEISALQARRRTAGLPPLIVATDQEGGIVSHLSPPLTAAPALASFADLPPDILSSSAEHIGRMQGKELAALGVNLNFSPVLDLKPEGGHNRFDFNTLIGKRAISDDPDKVAQVGIAYVRGLNASGVQATVKHFPGLGRVATDTHHFAASLDTPVAQFEQTDWRPFREVLGASNAAIMVGHVTLTAVDPDRPASYSKKVINGIIRQKWNYQGIVVTDDLVMGAVYNHLCTAVVGALDAGVDLLLVAFDASQFYGAFACASNALDRRQLDLVALHDSERRLERGLWAGQLNGAGYASVPAIGPDGDRATSMVGGAKF